MLTVFSICCDMLAEDAVCAYDGSGVMKTWGWTVNYCFEFQLIHSYYSKSMEMRLTKLQLNKKYNVLFTSYCFHTILSAYVRHRTLMNEYHVKRQDNDHW